MSPTTRMPVPMIERPVSVSGAPCPFSVKMAMSILLSHDREGIERLPRVADFEMQMRRGGSARAAGKRDRSEEHTSELQSRLHLVCRLLLEKKKKKKKNTMKLKTQWRMLTESESQDVEQRR